MTRRSIAILLLAGCALATLTVWEASITTAFGAAGDGRAPVTQPVRLLDAGGESVSFSRDGRLILTTGRVGARVWDARTFEPVSPPLPYRAGGSAELSPDNTKVVTTTGREAVVFDLKTGKQLYVLTHPGDLTSVVVKLHFPNGLWPATFSPDGQSIATGGGDHTIRVWNLATGQQGLAIAHEGGVGSVAFSPDGARLVACGGGSTYIWDARTGRRLTKSMSGALAAFSPDGKRIVTRHGDTASVYDVATGEHLFGDVAEHSLAVDAAALSADGTKFVVAMDGEARVWDLSDVDHPVSRTLRERDRFDQVTHAVFSPDGREVLTCSRSSISGWHTDMTAIWDAATGARVSTVRGVEIGMSGAFSPDGKMVAVTGRRHRPDTDDQDAGYTVVWRVGPAKGATAR